MVGDTDTFAVAILSKEDTKEDNFLNLRQN